MRVLELKIKGVFQSWGSYGGNLNFHPTDYKPTESAIIGMIAAGLGIRRTQLEMLDSLKNSLKIIIQEPDTYPQIYRDYQTVSAHPVKLANYLSDKELKELKKQGKEARFLRLLPDAQGEKTPQTGQGKIIYKDYVVDQEYTIFVESSSEEYSVENIQNAIQHPYYPLFLGRKCCSASRIKTKIVENP